MKKSWRLLSLILLGAVLAYGVFLAVRARSNLVTLNVRNADLVEVISQIEWQTREDIIVGPAVKGAVTLNVRKVPLEEVLRIIGEQTSSRALAVYPIYSRGATLQQLKATAQSGKSPGDSPWKSWTDQPAFRFAGPFGNAIRDENRLVNVQFTARDAAFAAQSLNRASSDRVVVEDGTPGLVTLKLTQATLPDAVAQVAKQVRRKWTVFYLLTPAPFMGRPGLNPMSSTTPEQKAEAQKQFESSLATLSPEEQEKARERREQFEKIRELPPEQRAPAMQQAAQQMMQQNPGMQDQMRQQIMERFTSGLRDSTPEQRLQRNQMINERRKMFENSGGSPARP